ncbi:MAG TPA: rhamnan synthesis F family protein [Acetobacteraceae bacterium]|nr:rhamnan synthesis F family protein [Acetobacteraceae bacterium]
MPFANALARLARRFASGLRNAFDAALLPFGLLLARLDLRPTIRTASPIRQDMLGPKVAVFCHFDRAGRIRDDLRHYLAELGRCGFSIVFVSNSRRLQPAEIVFLQKHCAGVITRRNAGFDFSAWKDALLACGLPRPDTSTLLLVNDSVYGPIRPLWPTLSAIDFAAADLWALTDSWQLRYHLQSYFLIAGPRVLQSHAWKKFWSEVRPLAMKRWVIRRFEIGLSQTMLRAGFRLHSVWPYHALLGDTLAGAGSPAGPTDDPLLAAGRRHERRIRQALAEGLPLNPTSDLWRSLLRRGYPFLKRELLRQNPTRIADLWDWRALLAETSEIDPAVILTDLARSARNRAP